MKKLGIAAAFVPAALTVALAAGMVGCASGTQTEQTASNGVEATSTQQVEAPSSSSETKEGSSASSNASSSASSSAQSSSAASSNVPSTQQNVKQSGMSGSTMDYQPGDVTDKGYTANDKGIALSATLNTAEAFTERDLAQTADTSSAKALAVVDGKDITITEEGVYVISGSASESTIVIEAADTAKVQLVLDNVRITNTDFPAIYVKSADKVLITLQGNSSLSVTGTFVADGETATDGVIFSKDDLCLNGSGSLTINSTDHAIVSKDDLKVTGGTYTIDAGGSALSANDSVRIANGSFTIKAADGIKAKNDDDNELGYVYIADGTFDITTTDNCIQGYAFVQIDGGTLTLNGAECIEGTYVQINGGKTTVNASDDGINASIKSSVYTPTIDITGGEVNVNMGSGDTDALDSNGYICISGGTVNIQAQSAFDYVWGADLTGGTVTVNGTQISEISGSMMGGGFGGGRQGRGFGGQMPQNGQAPEGMDPSQAPEGMEPPEGFDSSQMPEGTTPPDFSNGERPQRPDRSSTNQMPSSEGTTA